MATSSGYHVIVGGLGGLGRALQKTLLEHGKHKIRVVDMAPSSVVATSGNRLLQHPSLMEYVSCKLPTYLNDDKSDTVLKQAFQDAEAVYAVVTPDVLKASAADMKRTNVQGVEQLVNVCKEVGVHKFLYASSMAVTNQLMTHHEENEDTPLPAWDTYRITYDITKRQGEEIVSAANDANFQTCSLRLGAILSGPVDYNTRHFVENPGKVVSFQGQTPIDYISALDISRAFLKASEKLNESKSPVAGRAFFVTKCKNNQSTKGSQEVQQLFAEKFGWKYYELPSWVKTAMIYNSRAIQGVKNIISTPTDETILGMPFDVALETSDHEFTFDNSLARKLLEFEPRETWQDAVERIAVEFRQAYPHLFTK